MWRIACTADAQAIRNQPDAEGEESDMSRFTSSLIAAAVIGQVVGQLGWVDALFIPLVLLGPIVSGAIAAARRVTYAWIAVLWCSVGISMTWSDWAVNNEDVAFHLAL